MAEINLRQDLLVQLAKNVYINAQAVKVAIEIMVAAKALAFTDAYETGRYMEGIVVRGSSVNATDWKSNWIEFGAYGRAPPFTARHILRRGAEVAGYRVVAR